LSDPPHAVECLCVREAAPFAARVSLRHPKHTIGVVCASVRAVPVMGLDRAQPARRGQVGVA
jgi:hypothetical protein